MRLLLFLPLLSLVAGCGDDLTTHKGIAAAQADAYGDMADVFDSIKDKSSAEAAKSKLEAIMKRLAEAEAAMMNAKGELTIQDMQAVANKLAAAEKQKDEAFQKMHERIKNDPAAMAVLDNILR